MESLKKIISLNQGAALSGYSQDYLGYLIRHGEIKGIKKGRTWFTTKEEIDNYLFKKKVRNSELAVREFFSFSRKRNILIVSLVVFIIIGYIWFAELNKSDATKVVEIKSALTSDGEAIQIISN